MRIWHISDTHSYHHLLTVPKDIDMVIHSGDGSNYRDIYKNQGEYDSFLFWYKSLPIKHKILIGGNHDTALEKNLFDIKSKMEDKGIIYLENNSVEIEGLKIWGSPYVPTYGNWSFMKARNKIDRVWQHIPEDTDILVVHGPPKGILDISVDRNGNIERCGCGALTKKVFKLKELKLVLFGHIHNCEDVINAATIKLASHNATFSNASVVTDNKFGTLSSNGNIFEIIK